MHKNLMTAAVAAALLAGCTSSGPRQAYKEPQAGPVAHVTFRNATPGRTGVVIYENAAACNNRRTLPALLVGESRTVAVPGGEPLAFTFRYTIPNRTPDRFCEVTASFQTSPDGRYVATVKPSGENSCTVDLARVERDASGQIVPRGGVTATLRSPVKSSTEAGPFCTAQY